MILTTGRILLRVDETRLDTRQPQSRAGGQGPSLRSPYHLGRSSEAKDHKNPKKVNQALPLNQVFLNQGRLLL